MTIEPTASFWDCPEFITTGYKLEIYYANMAKMPEMDAATFAAQLGNAEKGKTGQVGAVETVTVGGQNYSRVDVYKRQGMTRSTLRDRTSVLRSWHR